MIYNNYFIICRMPLTPISALLFDISYVSIEWPVLRKRLNQISLTQPKQECELNPSKIFIIIRNIPYYSFRV